jgi:hypothetical protein
MDMRPGPVVITGATGGASAGSEPWPDDPATGFSTIHRLLTHSNACQIVSTGQLRMGFFTAVKSLTSTQHRFYINSARTAATMLRHGVYKVDSEDVNALPTGTISATLIGSTINDPTMYAASSWNTKPWAAPIDFVQGQRYGFAVSAVGGTPGSTGFLGSTNLLSTEYLPPRRLYAAIVADDLPATFTEADLTTATNTFPPYVVMLP